MMFYMQPHLHTLTCREVLIILIALEPDDEHFGIDDAAGPGPASAAPASLARWLLEVQRQERLLLIPHGGAALRGISGRAGGGGDGGDEGGRGGADSQVAGRHDG
jgi:hypothetical protein